MSVEHKSPGAKPHTAVPQQPTKAQPSQRTATPTALPRPQAVLQRAQADPSQLTPAEVDVLQRTIGLRAANRMLGIPPPPPFAVPIQLKLMVGPAGDKYEQEADRVARQVVNTSEPVQRVEENGETLQLKDAADTEHHQSHSVLQPRTFFNQSPNYNQPQYLSVQQPVTIRADMHPVQREGLAKKRFFRTSQTTGAVVQRATAEWLKGVFDLGITHIHEFRTTIGDEAFQVLLRYENAQISPLVTFFKAQPLPIANPQAQCDLLIPAVATPALPLVQEALTLANYNGVTAAPIKDYLVKHQAKGAKALTVARLVLTAKGNDPVAADLEMTELEGYNFNQLLKNKVETLGNQRASDEYDESVEKNKEKRSDYVTSYTDIGDIDPDQSDEALAELLSNKKATDEYDKAAAKNIVDRASFISTFKKETGLAHDHSFTRNDITKGVKIPNALKAIFPGEDVSTVQKVKTLIEDKMNSYASIEQSLGTGLAGKKDTYKQQVAKKLGEFETKKGNLDSGLEGNKAAYKTALKQAITPLFAFPEGDDASDWVLNKVGPDDKAAIQLVVWTINGFNAAVSLTDIKKIFTVFTLEQVKSFHTPAGVTDAKAQQLLQFLNKAKPGEDGKFKTLIERDESKDFKELLKFFTSANSNIDEALGIFSKTDKSADVNQLLTDLNAEAVAEPLKAEKDYLKHKGKAVDVSFLVKEGIAKDDSEKMLKKDWVLGYGEQVAHIYTESGDNVTKTIAVLDIVTTRKKLPKTPADVNRWLDRNHSFNNIHNKLQADNDQQFWDGEVCTENTVNVTPRTGQNDNINSVIANRRTAKVVGQFYSGGNFGNGGNGVGQPIVMVLPDNVAYTEYDLKPYKDDPSRGKRRMVVGGANFYYTGDHYETFSRFRP